MPDAKRARIAGRRLTVILPGTWANIPLDDERTARRYVKELVRRQLGGDDRLARLRAEAVDETMRTITAAVAVGVHTYMMSLELLPGVPFPAAILMADEPWPDRARPGLGADDLPRALREGFPGGVVIDRAGSPALRLAQFGESGLTDKPVQVLRLEYHLPCPGGDKLLYVRISVPDLPSADPFVALFDEIVDSIAFLPGEAAAGAGGTV